jgi:hypothetical protein
MEETIGNTLEETAYHEGGYFVVAGSLGLNLKPKGIMIYELANDITDGLNRRILPRLLNHRIKFRFRATEVLRQPGA